MKYGKYINGALHITMAPKDGYKPVTESKPEGYGKYQFVGYTETEDAILVEYEALLDAPDSTLQRIAGLEQRLEVTEGAVQELILGEVIADEGTVPGNAD